MTQRILAVAILFTFPIAAFLVGGVAVLRWQHDETWWPCLFISPAFAVGWWDTLRGNRELARHAGYVDGLTRAVELQRGEKVRP